MPPSVESHPNSSISLSLSPSFLLSVTRGLGPELVLGVQHLRPGSCLFGLYSQMRRQTLNRKSHKNNYIIIIGVSFEGNYRIR